MQYTASSFASLLVTTFRGLLWPDRSLVAPAGSFPSAAHLETSAPDIAEHELFEPVFRSVARFFLMVRTVSWLGEQESRDAARSGHKGRRGPVRTLITAIVRSLRRGSIQIRLFFIALTLVVLFMFEANSAGRRQTVPRQDDRPNLNVGEVR